jgi:hypothetical protein
VINVCIDDASPGAYSVAGRCSTNGRSLLAVRSRNGGMLLAELAIAGLTLAACAGHGHKRGDSQRADPNAFPTNHKGDLIALVRTSVGDPTNIREAYISEPTLKVSGTENRYVVCARFNARGSDGRYLGLKEKMVIYFAGSPNQYIDATPDKCGSSVYQPFPELESLTR